MGPWPGMGLLCRWYAAAMPVVCMRPLCGRYAGVCPGWCMPGGRPPLGPRSRRRLVKGPKLVKYMDADGNPLKKRPLSTNRGVIDLLNDTSSDDESQPEGSLNWNPPPLLKCKLNI